MNNETAVIILAGGKGTRIGATDIPKVMIPVCEKPMVEYAVETLVACGFSSDQICMVVGYEGEKITEHFGDSVRYATQRYRLGTAHAAYCGMRSLPSSVKHVLVMGGDDSAFYKPETLSTFFSSHINSDVVLSLLTAHVENPESLGRVLRKEDGTIRVIEKENLTEDQKAIQEISTGTFCFDRWWFQEMFPDMPVIPRLDEYGLPTAITEALKRDCLIQAISMDDPDEWFGVNTKEQLAEAERRMSVLKK